MVMNNPLPFPSNILASIRRPTTLPHDTDEDERLKHFEQVRKKSSKTALCNLHYSGTGCKNIVIYLLT